VISDSRFHRGRAAERLVDAAEIVEREPHCDGGPVVLPLLTESVRQPGEATNAHARAQIGPLDNRSADALRVGLAHDWDYLHGLHFGGTVAAFAVRRGPVHLDELCEIAAVVQRGGDR